MLVNVACLDGNCADIAHARVLAVIKRREIKDVYDIGEILAQVYTDPKCPYPIIGSVEAGRGGIIKPSLSNKFFWITVAPNGPVIIDDFGSTGSNRLDRFHSICAAAAQKHTSIWDFAEQWKATHHKSSTEALVHSYVNYVTTACSESNYRHWLGATGVFDTPPYASDEGNSLCVGIDVSALDTTNELPSVLEDYFYKQVIKTHNLEIEAKARSVISNFMFYKGLSPDLIVGDDRSSNYISHDKVDSIKKSLHAYYSKMTH